VHTEAKFQVTRETIFGYFSHLGTLWDSKKKKRSIEQVFVELPMMIYYTSNFTLNEMYLDLHENAPNTSTLLNMEFIQTNNLSFISTNEAESNFIFS